MRPGGAYPSRGPPHADAGDGLGRDALAAAGEAEALRGRRLDTDLVDAEAGDLRDPCPHCGAIWPHLRLLRDDRTIHMIEDCSLSPKQVERVRQEAVRRRAFPLQVRGREMFADIAEAGSAE